MELTLERVRVADIRPLVDEYGNELVSRDYSLKVNLDYVKELAESFGPGGEPDEQVKLVRDGDVYRIKAGNSRVHAMELLGTEECWAVIDEDDTVQSVVETVVRTNTKKKYEPVEESRFVQQLALFGGDEYVSEVARLPVDKARRMRRGRELAGDRAETVTLDRLYELADFDGDDEAVEEILSSDEGSWRDVAGRIRAAREKDAQERAFRARAAELGITLVDSLTDDGASYIARCEDPDSLAGDYMAASAGYEGIVCKISETWGGWSVVLYGEPLGSGETPEEAERRRVADEYESSARRVDESVAEWFDDRIVEASDERVPESLGELAGRCVEAALEQYWVGRVVEAFPGLGADEPCRFLLLAGYLEARSSLAMWARDMARDEPSSFALERMASALGFIGLHEAAGWEPDEEMAAFLEAMRAKVADGGEER